MTQCLTHGGLPEGMTRWQFFGLIQRARRQLGMTKGTIEYLKVAISNTTEEDFLAGRICSFWTSVTKIAAQAGLDRRQIARIEAWLIANSYLVKTASDHSRRAGSRKDGKIGHEFGINLAPLIARAAEIQVAARKAIFEAEESERLRSRIKKLFGDIRRLRFEDAMEAAEEILPNRRPSTVHNFERLKQVAEALEAVWADFSSEIGGGEKSHQCDISPPLNTKEENKSKTCSAKKQDQPAPVCTTPAQAALLASPALREAIELYWNSLDNRGLLSWRTIELASQDRARQLGVSASVWRRQCDILDPKRAALCLLIADRNAGRFDSYRVRDVAGAFLGMVRKEVRQGAVVKALVGELTAFARGNSDV